MSRLRDQKNHDEKGTGKRFQGTRALPHSENRKYAMAWQYPTPCEVTASSTLLSLQVFSHHLTFIRCQADGSSTSVCLWLLVINLSDNLFWDVYHNKQGDETVAFNQGKIRLFAFCLGTRRKRLTPPRELFLLVQVETSIFHKTLDPRNLVLNV